MKCFVTFQYSQQNILDLTSSHGKFSRFGKDNVAVLDFDKTDYYLAFSATRSFPDEDSFECRVQFDII